MTFICVICGRSFRQVSLSMLTVCIVYSMGQVIQALFTVYLRADCTLRLLLVKVIQAGERLLL